MADKTVIATSEAPAAIGPYSQAIRVGELLFVSGQVGFDPATGNLVAGDVTVQAQQALKNLQAILQAANTTMQNVVKTTVFLIDMNDFAAMNELYGTFFTQQPPARSTVAVAQLPRGARFEIECVAIIPEK